MRSLAASVPASGGTGAAVPRHVAIIMDGNGRWAKARRLPRIAGHRQGAEAVRRVARAAREMGIEALTLYAFSSENWRRPEEEVSDLMGLLRHFLLGPDWRAYWLGCFTAGLGVITKGVGVIALLMLLPYALARRAADRRLDMALAGAGLHAGTADNVAAGAYDLVIEISREGRLMFRSKNRIMLP